MPPETKVWMGSHYSYKPHKRATNTPKNAKQLFNALDELVQQLELIGIPDWHGAEGLSLLQAKKAIKNAKKSME